MEPVHRSECSFKFSVFNKTHSIQGNEVHSKKETASPDKDAKSEGTP